MARDQMEQNATSNVRNSSDSLSLLIETLPDDERDAFGYHDLCKKVADIIISNDPPFVFALCGNWGSGKTTFLQYLLDYLPKPDKGGIIIYFNSWRASVNNNHLICFVNELISQLDKNKSIKNLKRVDELRQCGEDLLEASIEAFSELNILTSLFARFASKLFKRIIKNKINADETMLIKFEKICSILASENIKPIVLIDDLDRCTPNTVVEIIEAIRMIFCGHDQLASVIKSKYNPGDEKESEMRNVPFKYILAIDEYYLANAFKEYYKLSNLDSAHNYLSKFIQFRYHFPLKTWKPFLERLLKEITVKYDVLLAMPEKEMASFINMLLINFKVESPREVKRIISTILTWLISYYDEVNEFKLEIINLGGEKATEILMKLMTGYLFIKAAINVLFTSEAQACVSSNLIIKIIDSNTREAGCNEFKKIMINDENYDTLKGSINITTKHFDTLYNQLPKIIENLYRSTKRDISNDKINQMVAKRQNDMKKAMLNCITKIIC